MVSQGLPTSLMALQICSKIDKYVTFCVPKPSVHCKLYSPRQVFCISGHDTIHPLESVFINVSIYILVFISVQTFNRCPLYTQWPLPYALTAPLWEFFFMELKMVPGNLWTGGNAPGVGTTQLTQKRWCREILHFPAVHPQGLEYCGHSRGKMRGILCLAIPDP